MLLTDGQWANYKYLGMIFLLLMYSPMKIPVQCSIAAIKANPLLEKEREKKGEQIIQNHAVPEFLNAWSSVPLPSKKYIIMGKDRERRDKEDQRYGTSGVQGKI